MLRTFAYPLVLLATKWIDQTVPEKKLRELLLRGLEDLEKRSAKDCCDSQGDDWENEITLIRQRVAEAGLWESNEGKESSVSSVLCQDRNIALEQIDAWIERVPGGKVVTAKRLVKGTGLWLDRIESAGYKQHREFADCNLQSLLRHVEIRREKCLQPVLPALSASQQWLEKHDVAILFARSARRRHDLRLLNAAMKLNDWAYPSHRKLPVTPRYLLSLAEQEKSVQELML